MLVGLDLVVFELSAEVLEVFEATESGTKLPHGSKQLTVVADTSTGSNIAQ